MKTTYRWIREYLGFDISPQEMMDKLTTIGHEVDSVTDLGLLGNPIRIARITCVEPHPSADKLSVCSVDDGSGKDAQVVCGAPNAAAGAVSVLARSGARLPNGTVLEHTKIRGVQSEGMLLALDEMGLGTDHSGIAILEPDAPIGEGYDLILDLEITPNRPDCLSVFGLARDLAAACGGKTSAPSGRFRESHQSAGELVDISIKCPDDCPRYTARVIQGIGVAPSPDWAQRKLLAVGLRPINNVVDATNLALMELGHPLHAFDYDRVGGRRVIVRLAEPGETMKLIDESELELAPGKDMVIADASEPIALAGVMGGFHSEVTGETQNILLESAYFNPTTIRLTARRHNASTDASYRFERGADPEGLVPALDRATALIVEWAGGTVAKGVVDTSPRPLGSKTLMLRADRACKVLGLDIPKTQIADLLAGLGFELQRTDEDILVVSVPSFRVDVSREEDLYEEIARLYGYDRIPSTMPYVQMDASPLSETIRLRRFLQDKLAAIGFHEAINLSFISEDDLAELGMADVKTLHLRNPMSREQSTLRPALAPSMVRNLVYNQNRGNTDLRLFEISRTFHPGEADVPYVEKEALILAMMGAAARPAWRAGSATVLDFYDLKGVLEAVLESLGVSSWQSQRGAPPFLHPGRSARIVVDGAEIGWYGELSPVQCERSDLSGRPLLAQLELEVLRPLIETDRKFAEIPRYPAIERDLALVVDRETPAARVEEVIRSTAGELLESLFLFDCYTGEQVATASKSLGYRAVYRHAERTLKDEEVEAIQARVLRALEGELGAMLRA